MSDTNPNLDHRPAARQDFKTGNQPTDCSTDSEPLQTRSYDLNSERVNDMPLRMFMH